MCAFFASNIGYCRHRLTLMTYWSKTPSSHNNMVRLITKLGVSSRTVVCWIFRKNVLKTLSCVRAGEWKNQTYKELVFNIIYIIHSQNGDTFVLIFHMLISNLFGFISLKIFAVISVFFRQRNCFSHYSRAHRFTAKIRQRWWDIFYPFA